MALQPYATLAQVRAQLQLAVGETDNDTFITNELGRVSSEIDTWMGWTLRADDTDPTITEVLDSPPGENLYLETAGFVETLTTVKEDAAHVFTGSNVTTLTVNEDFVLYAKRGLLKRINSRWLTGFKVVQVVYEGGYLTPDANGGGATVAMPTDVVNAAIQEVIARMKTRDLQGFRSISDDAGNVSAIETEGLLEQTMNRLSPYSKSHKVYV